MPTVWNMTDDGLVQVEVSDADDMRDRLRGLAAQLMDLRPLWPLVFKQWQRHMSEQFATAGAWGGRAWAPTKRSSGKGILVDTGFMASHVRGPKGPKRSVRARSMTLTIADSGTVRGKERPRGVAIYHQTGTSRMPARPIIPDPYPQQGVEEMQEVARKWADEVIESWGFGGS